MDKEIRTVSMQEMEVREDVGPPVIEGYAAVFNTRTTIANFDEQIAPGAFRGTLASNPDVRATIEHEGGLTTIGRTRNRTLSLWEDERGLRVRIQPPDTQAGRDALTLVRGGYVDQMSFAFRVGKDGQSWSETEDRTPLRTLTAVDLNDGDVSIVTYPAYPQTSAEARDMASAMCQVAVGEEEAVDEVEGADEGQERDTQARLAAARKRRIKIQRMR